MAIPDTYFSVHFNSKGEMIGVTPPEGKEAEKTDIRKNPLKNVDELVHVTLVGKPNHSLCCVECGGILYCWC